MSDNYSWGDRDLKLPAGQWVNRGPIRVFVANSRTWKPCEGRPELDLWETIAANLADIVPVTPTRGHICDCGCLILAAEDCPMCLWNSLQNEGKVA